jgi:hypothetical protein
MEFILALDRRLIFLFVILKLIKYLKGSINRLSEQEQRLAIFKLFVPTDNQQVKPILSSGTSCAIPALYPLQMLRRCSDCKKTTSYQGCSR